MAVNNDSRAIRRYDILHSWADKFADSFAKVGFLFVWQILNLP